MITALKILALIWFALAVSFIPGIVIPAAIERIKWRRAMGLHARVPFRRRLQH